MPTAGLEPRSGRLLGHRELGKEYPKDLGGRERQRGDGSSRHSGRIYTLAWSPDSKRLAQGARTTGYRVEVETGKKLLTLSHGDIVNSVAWAWTAREWRQEATTTRRRSGTPSPVRCGPP